MKPAFSIGLFAVCVLLSAPLRAAAADPVSEALQAMKYRAIGPAISGGRTTAVAGSDADPRIYYAGGAGGGVFRSDDGGVSWRATFDAESTAAVGAISVSAKNPNDVWVGTGESNPRNDVQEGAGVWHSTDGGKTWQHVGLDDSGTISRISLDPRDPKSAVVGVLGHVFRDGTSRGIFVTHDCGAHWTRTLYVGPASGVSDVARMPGRPDTLFAGVWQFRRQPWMMSSGGPLGGLYRSDDSGRTWRKLTGNGLPGGLTGRIGIATASATRIYAIVQSRVGELWRSDNAGATWQRAPHSPYIGARPFYFSNIYANPAKPDQVLAVSLILSLSTNGARSFDRTSINGGWDYHSVWWSADGRRVIAGSDEGVTLSNDGAKHWWQPYDLPFSQPYHVAFDTANSAYSVCIGLQDNNSWCGPNSSPNGVGVLNRDWYVVGPGDGMHATFDPGDKNLIWQTSTNTGTGQVYLYDSRTSQTYDVSPSAANNSDKPADLEHRFNWDTPIAFAHDGTALAGGEVVFASSDKGRTWSILSPDLTRNDRSHQQISGGPISQDVSGAETSDTLLCIAPSGLEPGVIWTGSDDGLVHVTRDAGKTWADVTPPGAPHFGRAYTVEPSHADAGTAYVAFDNHMLGDDRPYVFATSDYGKTWQSRSDGLLPGAFVRVVREDPTNANLLYAGTEHGISISFDRGIRWHDVRSNMPSTAIYDLAIQPQTNDLVVASHGRGVWILDDLSPIQDFAATNAGKALLFPPRDAFRLWQAPTINTFTDGALPDGDFVGVNRAPALFSYYLPKPARRVEIDILANDGRIVKHLTGKPVTNHAGVNRTTWDLTEDGPTRWMRTFEQNRGPKTGAEVIPGNYLVRLVADGVTNEAPLIVRADPRDPTAQADAVLRHDTLAILNGELSSIDTWLNAIDAKHGPAMPTDIAAFRARLTLDPQNVEDLRAPPGLRERVIDLLDRISSSSYQPPTAAESDEFAKLRARFDEIAKQWSALKLSIRPRLFPNNT